MRNNRKFQFLLIIVVLLFLLSGCSIPMDENKQIIQITSSTTFQHMMDTESWWSAFFVFPLSQAINYLSPKIGVASAIAAATIGVNVIVLALTFKSTVASQKMQLIQPELTKIQKKYEGKSDQASQMKQSQELQAVYAKHGINPFGTFIALFVQFPIIIAIYHAAQRAEAVRNGTFMGLALNVNPLDGFLAGSYGYVALFVVMTVVQGISMKLPQFLANRKAKLAAEAAGRRYVKQPQPGGAMMNMMFLMIPFISLSLPAAMTIYWAISAAVTIAKTLLVQVLLSKENNA